LPHCVDEGPLSLYPREQEKVQVDPGRWSDKRQWEEDTHTALAKESFWHLTTAKQNEKTLILVLRENMTLACPPLEL